MIGKLKTYGERFLLSEYGILIVNFALATLILTVDLRSDREGTRLIGALCGGFLIGLGLASWFYMRGQRTFIEKIKVIAAQEVMHSIDKMMADAAARFNATSENVKIDVVSMSGPDLPPTKH